MKVKLAVQVFSASVSNSLLFAQHQEIPGFENCDGTINFILMIDQMFDYLNTRNCLGKGYKAPLYNNTIAEYENHFDECIKTLKSLKLTNGIYVYKSNKKTCVEGLILSMKSILEMGKELLTGETPKMKFFLTYKTSQDHLELYFCSIRSRGGFNDNPSAYQVRSAVRISLMAKLDTTITGNCISLDNTQLICSNFQNNHDDDFNSIKTISNPIIPQALSYYFSQTNPHIPKLSLYLDNLTTYISGYNLLKKKRYDVMFALMQWSVIHILFVKVHLELIKMILNVKILLKKWKCWFFPQ
ncbi:uncharacterized protein LOC135931529 [Gordionus sp. m RMFG-2023]|uniref:uncharacterized protein LOC135931529 n=1 Tax=Gordionus sp. m RMFG-2023 TaxID=3053472 RepID=UPI0031FC5A2C